jgi:ribosomal protection tetracycline resistance protein
MICIERPGATGAALEQLGGPENPFLATVGLRVEPATVGSGVEFRLEAALVTLPLYVYKTVDEFRKAVAETVQSVLQQGLHGWRVTDCVVTMTHSGYDPPGTTAGDFRKLIPLVLMRALQRAGTQVCEPMHHFRLELPTDTLGPVFTVLARLGGVPQAPATRGLVCSLEGDIPAARVHALQQQLPGLTRGEGVAESAFAGYQPVRGAVPSRPRTDLDPLNRKAYLMHLAGRV